MSIARTILAVLVIDAALQSQAPRFRLEEATIADVHRAIQTRQITCRGLVQAYLDRAKAYNGVSNRLVTRDGAPIPQVTGTVRAGAPLKFPTETVAISTLLPDFDQYAGPPIEFGRMEPTASDPSVQQQYGMTVGVPNAGQLNALATLNLRGERSVTCKGDRDKPPSSGPLPSGSPPVCAEFRTQPDACEATCAAKSARVTGPHVVLRVTESVEHLPPGIDRRLIEAAGALRIHDPIVAAVADEERAFDLVGAAVQRVVAKFFPRVGEIARADDPPDAILNRRIVVEEIEETSAAPECPPRSSPRS